MELQAYSGFLVGFILSPLHILKGKHVINFITDSQVLFKKCETC